MGKDVKKKYHLSLRPTGEFYMTFDNFLENFDWLNVAHVNKQSFMALNKDGSSFIDAQWSVRQYFGAWKQGFNAGHVSARDSTLYDNNTYYYLKVNSKSEVCPMIIALMQPYEPKMRKENKGKYFCYTIALAVYKILAGQADIDEHLTSGKKFKDEHLELHTAASQEGCMRELTKRFYLEEGSYVVIPSCFEEDANTKYLLRFLHDTSTCSLIVKLDYK